MKQEEIRTYYLDRNEWVLREYKTTNEPDKDLPPSAYYDEFGAVDIGYLREIHIAIGTETQWREGSLVEGIDFFVVEENPEPGIEEVAYPKDPVFTLDNMLQAFEAGFECHATFPNGKEGFKKLYFKTLRITLPETDIPF